MACALGLAVFACIFLVGWWSVPPDADAQTLPGWTFALSQRPYVDAASNITHPATAVPPGEPHITLMVLGGGRQRESPGGNTVGSDGSSPALTQLSSVALYVDPVAGRDTWWALRGQSAAELRRPSISGRDKRRKSYAIPFYTSLHGLASARAIRVVPYRSITQPQLQRAFQQQLPPRLDGNQKEPSYVSCV